MTAQVHRMEANHQVTGHLVLTCPACGYSVQIDEQTQEKKTLADGDKMSVPHAWGVAGLGGIGVSDGKNRQLATQKPATPPACSCARKADGARGGG